MERRAGQRYNCEPNFATCELRVCIYKLISRRTLLLLVYSYYHDPWDTA